MLLKLWLVHTLAQNYVPYERLRTTVQPSKGEIPGTLQTQVDFSRKNTFLIYNERSKTPLGDTPWRSGCQQRIHKSKCRKQAFLPRTEMQQEAFAYLISLRHNRHHRKSLAICLVIASYTKVVFNFCADKVYRKCVPSYCKLYRKTYHRPHRNCESGIKGCVQFPAKR